jgi:hypothetical protein
VSMATGYRLDSEGVRVRVSVRSVIFSTSCRPVLELMQPPVQWVPEVMQPGHEAHHSPPANAKAKKKIDLCFDFAIRLHGIVLS